MSFDLKTGVWNWWVDLLLLVGGMVFWFRFCCSFCTPLTFFFCAGRTTVVNLKFLLLPAVNLFVSSTQHKQVGKVAVVLVQRRSPSTGLILATTPWRWRKMANQWKVFTQDTPRTGERQTLWESTAMQNWHPSNKQQQQIMVTNTVHLATTKTWECEFKRIFI